MTKSNEVVYVPEDSYLKNLLELKANLKSTVTELLNHFDNGGDYEDRFNLQITCNGHTGYIELHADAFDRFMMVIESELSEYIAIKEADRNE